MQFKLEVTCNVCGSRDVEVELGCGQNVGGIDFRCLNRDCGEHEGFHEYSEVVSLNDSFRIGNGLMEEPWYWDRLKNRVFELARAYGRDKRHVKEANVVYVSSRIMDEIRELDYGRADFAEICQLRIVEVDGDDEYIEVGVG